jgi:hypothetical protein
MENSRKLPHIYCIIEAHCVEVVEQEIIGEKRRIEIVEVV